MRTRSGLLAMLVAALGACGRQPESDHEVHVRELCSELAGSGAGLTAARRALGDPQLELCADDLPPGSDLDRCPTDGTVVCLRFWAYRARNEVLCGGTACSYGCELRAPRDAPEATCAARWVDGYGSLGLPVGAP